MGLPLYGEANPTYCSKHAWSIALCCLSLSRAVVVICRTRSREIFKSRPICSKVSTGLSPRPKRREITAASRGVRCQGVLCIALECMLYQDFMAAGQAYIGRAAHGGPLLEARVIDGDLL